MARMQDEPLLRERPGICKPETVELHWIPQQGCTLKHGLSAAFQQGCNLEPGTSAAFLRGQISGWAHDVRPSAPSHFNTLEHRVRMWCAILQLQRNHSKEPDAHRPRADPARQDQQANSASGMPPQNVSFSGAEPANMR